ncbi:MAG: anti-sigma factor family protein [Actinomycetes bacterium]
MTREDITTCDEALAVLAQHLDRELEGHLDAQLVAHLEACRSCYSRAEFERRLKARIRELGSEPVPDDVMQRVQRLLQDFTSSTS